MASEDQTQEIEVLQSIYPDELTQISSTEFTLRLVLEPPSIPGQTHEPPILNLRVTFPPTYPDVAPDLDLTIDAASPPSSLSFPEDKEQLLSALAPTIEENLGMAMIFSLATTLKEGAETLLHERAHAVEKAREDYMRKEEEKEMEKFRGTLVTRERFMEWVVKFKGEAARKALAEKEKEEAEEKGKRGGGGASAAKEKRLTGRQLYERGIVGNADDLEEEVDGVEVDISKLKVKE